MRRPTYALAVTALAAACGATLHAQKTTPLGQGSGGSPHVRSEWTVDGAHVAIEYGRPYVKGRAVKDVAPFGTEWRTGADQATTLKTDKALKIGTLAVPAGTYTIYTVPGEKEWQLIVSKKTGQWGIPYPAGQDLGRTPMKVGQASAPADQLTISIDPAPKASVLRVEWGTTSASVPITAG
jgi:Protein of unknown function (DUF2911)